MSKKKNASAVELGQEGALVAFNGGTSFGDLPTELTTEYLNPDGFKLFDQSVRAMTTDITRAKERLAWYLYMIAEYDLYAYGINEDTGEAFRHMEEYLKKIERDTGRGLSTMKRDMQAIRSFIKIGADTKYIADKGIVVLSKVFQVTETERDGTPKKPKFASLKEGQTTGQWMLEAAEQLSFNGKEELAPANDRDKATLEQQVLKPSIPQVFFTNGASGRKWNMRLFVDGSEVNYEGKVDLEVGDDGSLSLTFHPDQNGFFPDPVMDKITKLFKV